MPESNKQAKKRLQKANRAAGIGDEQGRIVREKAPPKLLCCSVCQHPLKVTKTNTELIAHSESKHGKTIDVCFPGAKEAAAEMVAAGKNIKSTQQQQGPSKAQKKQSAAAGLDDLLNAGLCAGKKKGKK